MFENGDIEDINNLNNINQEPYPYIKEISDTNDIRKIKILGWKGLIIGIIILLCLQVVLMLIGFLAFDDSFLRLFFCFLNIPYLLILLLAPAKAICTYDYTNQVFSSYVTPIIPIPYICFSTKVNFREISGFFLYKMKKYTKKYYQIGIRLEDGNDQIIQIGQDHTISKEFDKKLEFIPYILRALLKPGKQNII